MHISYEAGILEVSLSGVLMAGIFQDPSVTPPDRMWLMTKDPISAPDAPEIVELEFEKGLPVSMKYRGKDRVANFEKNS